MQAVEKKSSWKRRMIEMKAQVRAAVKLPAVRPEPASPEVDPPSMALFLGY